MNPLKVGVSRAKRLRKEAKHHVRIAQEALRHARNYLHTAARNAADFDCASENIDGAQEYIGNAMLNFGTARGLNNAATDLEEDT